MIGVLGTLSLPPADAATGKSLIIFTEGWETSLSGTVGSALCAVDDAGRTYRFATTDARYGELSVAPVAGAIAGAAFSPAHNGISDRTVITVSPMPTTMRTPLTIEDAEWPSWSLHENELAYQAPANAGHVPAESSIYVSAADGSNRKRVAAGLGPISWSPDGGQIAFVRSGIIVAQADGSESRQVIAADFVHSLAWAPDGSKLLFVAGSTLPAEIEVVAVDGSDRHSLAPGLAGLAATWSPDGLRVAFVSRYGIEVVNADGTARRYLTRGGTSGIGVPAALDWKQFATPDAFANLPPCAITENGAQRTLNGSRFADNISGTAAADRIAAGAGSDIVYGLGGADTIAGGADNDQIDGGSGNDRVSGGSGNDLIVGGTGADTLIGSSGHDIIRGGTGNDTIYAGDGLRDVVSCGSGRDTVYSDERDVVAKHCERVLHK
jgi:Ca2+-binding RTX toxin-like protein